MLADAVKAFQRCRVQSSYEMDLFLGGGDFVQFNQGVPNLMKTPLP